LKETFIPYGNDDKDVKLRMKGARVSNQSLTSCEIRIKTLALKKI
jgi:hypothetical protein